MSERDTDPRENEHEQEFPPPHSGEPGAEGGDSADRDTPPGLPSEEDDSALGDTDQHSGAQA